MKLEDIKEGDTMLVTSNAWPNHYIMGKTYIVTKRGTHLGVMNEMGGHEMFTENNVETHFSKFLRLQPQITFNNYSE